MRVRKGETYEVIEVGTAGSRRRLEERGEDASGRQRERASAGTRAVARRKTVRIYPYGVSQGPADARHQRSPGSGDHRQDAERRGRGADAEGSRETAAENSEGS